ncbi:hypothetical protein CCR75_002871 [Bremia lactucae]|uniref:PH domain-containing protein n=1 Tax=Bremia lactucae TaxID=4779 RepID=A0A976FMP2_BRELC|nr:hypothetical protein CCR75_002871 [Bremia lactucae]
MKALAHRLRGRRRYDDEVNESGGFRFEEAVMCLEKRRPTLEKAMGDKIRKTQARRDDHWRKNRDLKARACSTSRLTDDGFVSAKPPVPARTRVASIEQQQRLLPRVGSDSSGEKTDTTSEELLSLDQDYPQSISVCTASPSSVTSRGRPLQSRYEGPTSPFSRLSVRIQRPDVTVEVRYSGYLTTPPTELLMRQKRYYFIVCRRSELFSCTDEEAFKQWRLAGRPLDVRDKLCTETGSGPVLVGTVLRADRTALKGADNSLTLTMEAASKDLTLDFIAKDKKDVTQWLEALLDIQLYKVHESDSVEDPMNRDVSLLKKEHKALNDEASMTSSEQSYEYEDMDIDIVARDVVLGDMDTRVDSASMTRQTLISESKRLEDVSTRQTLISETKRLEDVSTTPSLEAHQLEDSHSSITTKARTVSIASNPSVPSSQLYRMNSFASHTSSTLGPPHGSPHGNVLLFVPMAGSSLTASASRMNQAHCELVDLMANGHKVPSRGMQRLENIEWRYGVPEYVLTDLAYVRGRTREPDTTPLASYVEECCQTFIMEATHKARYDQWESVNHAHFYLQVNDSKRIQGSSILENDMFGLLYLGDTEASIGTRSDTSRESQDLRVEVAKAFPDGFPMEVLEVFTQPPQCYFSWRHWGSFTGKYKGIQGNGSNVEVRGFGEMTVDASRMRSLRLFFKLNDLISALQHVTDLVPRARRDSIPKKRLQVPNGRMARAASATVASVTRMPELKTSEIIEGLANFTIEAKEQRRKQTQ